MRRSAGSDHLAHSFTDLMTSLMVIFILLLLVFVNNQGSADSVTAERLLTDLRREMEPAGFSRDDLRIDPKDPSTILLTMADAQLHFRSNDHRLERDGERFVETQMPKLAAVLCAEAYRDSVETVVVEGHSDSTPYAGATVEESQVRNLKLSQRRGMEVVEKTLLAVPGDSRLRSCLLDKVSATGRGERDLEETAGKSRRAVIKIRVNASHAPGLAVALSAGMPRTPAAPIADSETLRILELLSRLQAVPRVPLSFRLSEEEVNHYLSYALLKTPRPGIDSVRMKFYPRNYVATLTVIDFDQIERWSPGLVPGVLNLNGKRALGIDVRFSVRDGNAQYKVEKAYYQGNAISLFIAEKIVQALGARSPEGFDPDQGLPLPFGIRNARTLEHYIEGEN